jgi:PsbN protein
METATVLIIFITSLLLGVTGYSVYTAFGPNSKDLRDPFEDHEDYRRKIRSKEKVSMLRILFDIYLKSIFLRF